MSLKALFSPESIAIIGASREERKIGHQCLKNLIDGGYKGHLYPVNPKSDEVLGLPCYPTVKEVPGKVDLALITVPARIVKLVLGDCKEKGVGAIAMITAGFSEVGNKELEDEVVALCKEGNMRLLGPNIVGLVNNKLKCNASFCQSLPYEGDAVFISQSGALAIALVGWTWMKKVGLSSLVTLGDMADVDFSDCIEYFGNDPTTKCIVLYIEGVKNARRFMESCQRMTPDKPIVALKAGISRRGMMATISHTGSMAGSRRVYEAAFKQSGVVLATTLEELFDKALSLSLSPPMMGDHCAVITNGGGAGVCAIDYAEKYHIPLDDLPADLMAEMRNYMPEFGSTKNPVDLTGMATTKSYEDALTCVLSHPWVDGVVVLYCHTAISKPMDVAMAIHNASRASKKPVVASLIGGDECEETSKWLKEQGVATYGSPEEGMSAISALRSYGRHLAQEKAPFERYDVDRDAADRIFSEAKRSGAHTLTEHEAKRVLEAYGIAVTRERVARDRREAVGAAEELGYPVVMKILSTDVMHKTDAGCVNLGVDSPERVEEAYDEIMRNARKFKPDANVQGVLVQEMAPEGREVILGGIKDPQFGPTVMFGMGGVLTEVLKDVAFRVAPISVKEAKDMMSEITGYPILTGVRGVPPADLDGLAEALSRVSQLISDYPDLGVVDVNPVIVYEHGLCAVDGLAILHR